MDFYNKPKWGLVQVLAIPALVYCLQFSYINYGPDLFSYFVFHLGIAPTAVSAFVFDYLIYFLTFVAAICLVKLLSGFKLSDIGFNKPDWKQTAAWGVWGGLAAFMLVIAGGYLVKWLEPNLRPQPFEEALRQISGPTEVAAMMIVGSVLAPLVEEMFFRGILYTYLRRYLNVLWSVVISALIFSIFHWDGLRLIPIALGGMLLAFIYEKCQNIYAPWIAHGVWNAIMALIVVITK